MKKIIFVLCAAILCCAFTSLRLNKAGIHGIIDPADGASKVWAISGTDSVSAIPVSGNFSIGVKPGTWTVVVVAVKPYNNAIVDNVTVAEGESADAGVIKLKAE